MSKGPGKVPRPRLDCSVQRSAFQRSIQWHCFESVMTSQQSLPAALAGIATMEIGGQNRAVCGRVLSYRSGNETKTTNAKTDNLCPLPYV